MLEKMTIIVIIIIIIISLYGISQPCYKHCFFFQFYSIHTFINYLHHIYPNKEEEEGKRKLMAWIEVHGGQGSLAFELTTVIFWVEIHKKKCAMATMDDYVSSNFMLSKGVLSLGKIQKF